MIFTHPLQGILWKGWYFVMYNRIYMYMFNVDSMEIEATHYFQEDDITVNNIRRMYLNWKICVYRRTKNNDKYETYLVDQRRGLKDDYYKLGKSRDFTKRYSFYDLVKHDGMKL